MLKNSISSHRSVAGPHCGQYLPADGGQTQLSLLAKGGCLLQCLLDAGLMIVVSVGEVHSRLQFLECYNIAFLPDVEGGQDQYKVEKVMGMKC